MPTDLGAVFARKRKAQAETQADSDHEHNLAFYPARLIGAAESGEGLCAKATDNDRAATCRELQKSFCIVDQKISGP
jgi:hypothetical protein